ncbi:MAG: primosomal protein N' [Deltaproteobacteria bacterium]|nr:primosomal protein N' [Deltaproteobacteria bacterium]
MSLRQPELFALPLVPAPAMYVEVAVPLPVRGAFTYGVPAGITRNIAPGARVVVPFGSQRLVGYVLSVSPTLSPNLDPERIKRVVSVLDEEPIFSEELLKFLREAADYYLYPLGEVLRTAAPAVDRREKKAIGQDSVTGKKHALRARWATVREETFVKLAPSTDESRPTLRGDKQAQVLAILAARGEVSLTELKAHVKSAREVVERLAARSLVEVERREIDADPFFGQPIARDVAPKLTPAQSAAAESIVESVRQHQRDTFLLHGVTGSGKTEVYLRAVDAVQRAGRGALILVPEIALTPQLVNRYRARFGDDLAVLHSGIKDQERHAMWRKLHSGECRVAIGARSAVFAPIRDLGLVLVDEEHDPSFKQDDKFRYHGRDLALLRAHRANAVCVLGSATPSIESFFAASEGRYRLLQLPERATNAPLPAVEIVDLRKVGRRGPTGHDLLSLPLVRALDETLDRGEQAILFLNRRGFAPSVRCGGCGKTTQCPSCSVALVLHRREGALRCHYCDFTVPYVGVCISCQSTDVSLIGVGTEKLEQNIVSAFPRARVGRLDRDIASGAGAEVVLSKLRRNELDILVGTQMVTKGHDFPRVTLVGVIEADASLALPDFRACERTFQLLSQVAGRAGRKDLYGRVIIQTFQPGHPVLERTKHHDYEGFYHDEIAARRELHYPPYGRLAALRLDSLDPLRVASVAESIARTLREDPEVTRGAVRVLGPAPSPIERVRSRTRMQALLSAIERPPLRRVLLRLADRLEREPPSGVRVVIDVDPIHML